MCCVLLCVYSFCFYLVLVLTIKLIKSLTLVSAFGVCTTVDLNTVVYFQESGRVLEELNIY